MWVGTEEEEDLGDDDDDDPLNSDDDDEEDSEDALTTENLVLCQYDKVQRTKNKWKATLKFGVSAPPTHRPNRQISLLLLVCSFLSCALPPERQTELPYEN